MCSRKLTRRLLKCLAVLGCLLVYICASFVNERTFITREEFNEKNWPPTRPTLRMTYRKKTSCNNEKILIDLGGKWGAMIHAMKITWKVKCAELECKAIHAQVHLAFQPAEMRCRLASPPHEFVHSR